MESYYYWDYEIQQISYISFLNKAMISKGTAKISANKIETEGKSFFQQGQQQNRKVFEINSNGRLEDYFYSFRKGEWIKGHFILYEEENED